jgi:hypothetical protein
MNITVVWIIIAICTITYCIALFKAASDIEKDLVREKFFDTNMKLRDIQMRVDSVERRLSEMENIENLIVRDDIPVHEEKDDEYYDGLLEWMDDNREE